MQTAQSNKMMTPKSPVKNKIQEVMLERGLNPAELARRVGVTRGAVHSWITESDKYHCEPLPQQKEKLAEVLGRPVKRIFPNL